ncbi:MULTISPECIES: CRISPR-associated endoribonuclease Cas6 [Clostridium]|uniref:CRISPR-associated endoribonuclease Cas6 n=1 Tax=Clostridium TaxID=1485 RepID=UPI000824323B|nr:MULTISPECIES: CRISPR-associated endoribonuclease Cas6 [Clostridium]PJI07106.1 CRISPR-associated endoribonuclease Cas6 [Clostridium sp. CT7]
MKYYEMKVTVLLKQDLKFTRTSEIIGKSISSAMLKSEELMKYHKQKRYKYVFNNFMPVEKAGIYKANRLYIFCLRTFEEDFMTNIKNCFQDYDNINLKIISVSVKIIQQKKIKFIRTITPAIVTIDSKPWLKNNDLLTLIKRIHANAEKKYKFFFGKEIGQVDDYFVEKLKILNLQPIPYTYKNITLLGNKFKIKVNDDDKSQKLAFVALGAGLAEKNSALGAGYCEPYWR